MIQYLNRPEEPIIERFDWLTWISIAFEGDETRQALRVLPRRRLEASYLLEDEDLRLLRWYLDQNLDEPWEVPEWHDPYVTDAESASGQAKIYFDTSFCDLVEDDVIGEGGDSVMILHPDEETYEIHTVKYLGVQATYVEMTANLANTYPVGTQVFRMMRGLPTEGQSLQRLPGTAGT